MKNNNSGIIKQPVDIGNVDLLLDYCEKLRTSELTPFKKKEDIALVLTWAVQNNLPFVTALTHITVINGKVAIDTHISRALLQRGGITGRTLEDFKPLYQYQTQAGILTQDDIDADPTAYKIYPNQIVLDAAVKSEKVKAGITDDGKVACLRSKNPVDYRTTVVLSRHIPKVDGGYHLLEEKAQFTWTDAIRAGLHEKDNYVKWPRQMLWARAYSICSSRIGADLLMGAVHKYEMPEYDGPPPETEDITYEEA